MASAAKRTIGKALSQRATQGRAGVFPALGAAIVAGAATAVLTYRLLRSGGSG